MDKSNFIMSYSIDKNFDSERFLKLRLRVCHDQESPNKTFFTVDTMRDANKSLEYIPLLAHVYTDENGKPVIGAHDMHIEENKLNPDEAKLIYDETPIGVIPSLLDNNCSIEEFENLNYTFVDCYVWRDYANYAEQLIEDAVNTKLSMEIDFPEDSLSYDAKNDRYNISSYRYRGITLLNESLGTGMKNALATTETFSAKTDVKEKMIVLMEELQKCLREYDNELNKEGVEKNMNKVDELLEKYQVTLEELDFETEGKSDEELEALFDEFACKKKKKCELETETETESAEAPVTEAQEDESKNKEFVETEPLVCSFRISHDDTRYGLQSLLNTMCDESHFFAIESVYDKYFYYCDYLAVMLSSRTIRCART